MMHHCAKGKAKIKNLAGSMMLVGDGNVIVGFDEGVNKSNSQVP
jgi:hypothetical protein